MVKMKFSEEDILRWFNQGIDTAKIAYLLRVSESDIANMLGRARDAQHNSNHTPVSTQCEQTLEDN